MEASFEGLIVVVGCGSIGNRHISNLLALGATEVIGVDESPEACARTTARFGISVSTDLERILQRRPAAVLICTPPHLHLTAARKALAAGADVFVEKPIAERWEGVDDLLNAAERQNLLVCTGYNLRFHEGLRLFKRLLDDGAIGRLLAVRAEVGQYLPDWRPAQDYRLSYIVNSHLGGGIILDASHELDYVRWIAGEVETVYCRAGHLSSLEMDTEDTAAIVLGILGGAIAEVHLDCVQRGYARTCKVIGDGGTMIWDFAEGVRLLDSTGAGWRHFASASEVNDMYLKEMAHFLECVRLHRTPLVDGRTGARTLQIALAARQSAASGQEISVQALPWTNA